MSAGRIVVGVDMTDASRDALCWAKAQADATGAELVVVTAWSYPPASYPTYAGYVPMRVGMDVEETCRTELETFVKDAIGDACVTLAVVRGHPAQVVLDAAHDATMVVVGSRGRGQILGALAGSVSQQVLTHARCPAVVVHHPAAA